MSIRISLIESLRGIAGHEDGDRQGILYGQPSDIGTVVESSQAVAAFDLDAVGTAMAATYDAVVGYYRIREGKSLELSTDEVELAESLFTRPGCVVLLVERRDGCPRANFFFLQHGRVMNHPLLEFPLDPATLTERESHRLRRADDKALVAYIPDAPLATSIAGPSSPPKATPGSGRRLTAILSMVAIVALVAVASFSAARFMSRPHGRTDEVVAATPTTPPAAKASLRAERQGDDLKIMWDLNSPAVADATSGILDIDDGGTPRRILMTADQVRFGSVLYSPQTEQISARLTTLKDDQSTGQESVLVLLSRPPQPQTGRGQGSARIPFEVKKLERVPPARALVPAAGNRPSNAPIERSETIPERAAPPASPPVASASLPPVSAARNEPAAPIVQAAPERVDPPASSVKPASPPVNQTVQATPERVDPPAAPARSASPPPATTIARSEPANPPAQVIPERVDPPASPARSVSPPPVTSVPRSEPAKIREEPYIAPVLVTQEGVRTPRELLPILIRPVTVTVRVEVDEAGRVTQAEAIPEKGIHSMLLTAAADAARRCRFQPAKRGRTPVPSTVTMVFHIDPKK